MSNNNMIDADDTSNKKNDKKKQKHKHKDKEKDKEKHKHKDTAHNIIKSRQHYMK